MEPALAPESFDEFFEKGTYVCAGTYNSRAPFRRLWPVLPQVLTRIFILSPATLSIPHDERLGLRRWGEQRDPR